MTACIGLIGDLVESRALKRGARTDVQRALEHLMAKLNDDLADALLSPFTITLGDEFQALLAKPSVLPVVLWAIEDAIPEVRIRTGIGYGTLSTPLKLEAAIGMDGPVFHAAREAVSRARSQQWLGGVFLGFGTWENRVLNGFARMLWTSRNQWTKGQREVTRRLRDGAHPRAIGEELGISTPAVYNRVRGAAWQAYEAASDGWRAMLEQFDVTRERRE